MAPKAPSQRGELGRPDALYARVRASVEATRASTTRPEARYAKAIVGALIASTAIVAIASQFVYGRHAAALESEAQYTSVPLILLTLNGITAAREVFDGRS